MLFTPNKTPKVRKNILIVDNRPDLELSLKPHLNQIFEDSTISPTLVRAKDGPDAASKADNQKFDMLLIDTDTPRLMDGGFVHGIRSYKNTQDAKIMVLSEQDNTNLPEQLRSCHFFKKPVVTSALVQTMSDALLATPQKNAKLLVDARVLNTIIKSTTKVFQQIGCTQITMGQASALAANASLKGDVSSVVEIKSQNFQGQLYVSLEKSNFLKVVSLMLMEAQSEINKDNLDAIGEITNIIFGNAKAEITDYNIQMTIPKVIQGNTQPMLTPVGSVGICIPFNTENGHFYISIIAFPTAN